MNTQNDERALIAALEKLVPILERIQRRELTDEDKRLITAAGIDIDELLKVIPEQTK